MLGVHHADSDGRRVRRSAFVEAVLDAIPVLEFGLEAARIHARITAWLATRGESIGPHGRPIAATALSHGFPVVTGNVNEFQRVPALRVLALE